MNFLKNIFETLSQENHKYQTHKINDTSLIFNLNLGKMQGNSKRKNDSGQGER